MPVSSNSGQTVCHFIPPSIKMFLTLAVIIVASLIPLANWPAHGLLLAVVLVGLSLAEVPVSYLARRLSLFLPLLIVFGLTIPMTQTNKTTAWAWAALLSLRCVISFLAGLWLIHVLPVTELFATLLRWRCPPALVAMLSFMYRYIFILWDELGRLRRARDARDFGDRKVIRRWTGNAQTIGLLIVRAMERAERTHHAMLARGWDGSVRYLGNDPTP